MARLCEVDLCTGCSACASSCPKKCIKMIENEKGFLVPEVDQNQCIDCGICSKTCPILNFKSKNSITLSKAYAVYNYDNKVVEKSSSGGLFSAIADKVIRDNGVVYGAAFNGIECIKHIRVDDINDLYMLQGSKYIQSVMGDIFNCVKKDLNSGIDVLFSGTPCQVAGLKNFLHKEYENLICIDTICHSVPSVKVWKKFIREINEENSSKVIEANFRYKDPNWQNYKMKLTLENGKEIGISNAENSYMKAFLYGLSTRESCYNCHFKGCNRSSDITLGDFWGVEKTYPNLFNDRGTSLAVINTDKGLITFKSIFDKIFLQEVDIDKALSNNTAFYNSSVPHKNRDKFFKQLESKNFTKNIQLLLAPTKQVILKNKIRSICVNIIHRNKE